MPWKVKPAGVAVWPASRPMGNSGGQWRRWATNSRLASGMMRAALGFALRMDWRVSASRWSVWLWLEVMAWMNVRAAGEMTGSVMRRWGLSVLAYFVVSESER